MVTELYAMLKESSFALSSELEHVLEYFSISTWLVVEHELVLVMYEEEESFVVALSDPWGCSSVDFGSQYHVAPQNLG